MIQSSLFIIKSYRLIIKASVEVKLVNDETWDVWYWDVTDMNGADFC